MASMPSFERSISLNDMDLALLVRELVQQDLISPKDGSEEKHRYLETTSRYTFVLPSFESFDVDFKKFIYSYLLDVGIYKELEACKVLNWCSAVFCMVPLLTIGDGNCLMHATSIAMWAINDRYQILRKAVYNVLIEDSQGSFHQRWQREHEAFRQQIQGGYEMTEEQWTREWQEVIQHISSEQTQPGPNALPYDSLEEIHIFVLANLLRRTIIVLSDDTLRGNYDESLSPINFGGIYLPLNWDPVDCVKTPLVIGFAQGHFTAIVSFADGKMDQGEAADGVEMEMIHGVPLVKRNGAPLPVHFLLKDEEYLRDGLLRQYLDCTKVTYKDADDGHGMVTLVARLHFTAPPDSVKNLVDGYFAHASETYKAMLNQLNGEEQNPEPPLVPVECRKEGCMFYGTAQTLFLCSGCLEEYLKNGGDTELKPAAKGSAAVTALPEVTAGLPPQWMNVQQKQYQLYQQQQQYPGQQHPGQQHPGQQHPGQHPGQQHPGQLYQEQQHQEQQQTLQYPQQQLQGQQIQHHQQQQQQQQQYQAEQLQQWLQPYYQPSNVGKTSSHQPQREQQSQKCATLGCKYKADETGKWCIRCNESERSADELASLTTQELEAKLCRNSVNGCKYFGLPGQHNLCSRCYRRFCIKMETSHAGSPSSIKQQTSPGRLLPTAPLSAAPSGPPRQPPTAPGDFVKCQEPNCQKRGVRELYSRCVDCYSQCIRTFISSEERSVNTTFPQSGTSTPPPPRVSSPSVVPTPPPESCAPPIPAYPPGAAAPSSPLKQYRQGNFCATPGCRNEKVPGLHELCMTCYQTVRPAEGTQRVKTEEHPTIVHTGALLKQLQLDEMQRIQGTSVQSNAEEALYENVPAIFRKEARSGQLPVRSNSKIYCKSPRCNNPIGSGTGEVCVQCFSDQYQGTVPSHPSLPPSTPQQAHLPKVCSVPGCNQPVGANTMEYCHVHFLNRPPVTGPQAPQEQLFSGRTARKQVPPLYIPSPFQATAFTTLSSTTPVGTAAQAVPPQAAAPRVPPEGNETGVRCATPNCTFFGKKEKNFLCSSCYNRNVAEWNMLNQFVGTPVMPVVGLPHVMTSQNVHMMTPIPANRPPVFNPPAPSKCAMEGCNFPAANVFNGMCQSCYYKAVHNEAEWNAQQREAAAERQKPTARATQQQQQQQGVNYPYTQPTPQIQTRREAKTTRPTKANFVSAGTPCKSKGCLKFGTPEKDDLCESCFEKYQRKQATKKVCPPVCGGTSSASPSGYGPSSYATSAYGTQVTMAQNPQAAMTSSTFTAQTPVQASRFQNALQFGAGTGLSGMKCRQPGCSMYGTYETNGYCSKCLMDMTRSVYPESVPDASEVRDEASQRTTADQTVCSVAGCFNLANPYLPSHCTQCFEKYYPHLASNEDYLSTIMAGRNMK